MFKKILSLILIVCFLLTSLSPYAQAQPGTTVPGLPAPGTMVNLSPAYDPVIIRGLTVHKDNPFLFDFIVDVGQDKMSGEPLKQEGEKLIKYFLASLAIPDKDVWVNLSPYEKDKMVPEALGQTDMGRDLLEQDYILKQITASLIYPEKDLGKKFWDRVYAKAQEQYGTTQIPVNTFNKVWIMADRAQIFEHNQTALVVDSHLKVMLEEDYLALTKHQGNSPTHTLTSNIVRQIVLPELEREINTGKNFANLRQIFNSIILASWYKKNLKQALLNQVYADHSHVKGIERPADVSPEQIYEQYLKAYKKGVFNYIKEDVNSSGTGIPRKYFSGGINPGMAADPAQTADPATLDSLSGKVMVDFTTVTGDKAMLSRLIENIRRKLSRRNLKREIEKFENEKKAKLAKEQGTTSPQAAPEIVLGPDGKHPLMALFETGQTKPSFELFQTPREKIEIVQEIIKSFDFKNKIKGKAAVAAVELMNRGWSKDAAIKKVKEIVQALGSKDSRLFTVKNLGGGALAVIGLINRDWDEDTAIDEVENIFQALKVRESDLFTDNNIGEASVAVVKLMNYMWPRDAAIDEVDDIVATLMHRSLNTKLFTEENIGGATMAVVELMNRGIHKEFAIDRVQGIVNGLEAYPKKIQGEVSMAIVLLKYSPARTKSDPNRQVEDIRRILFSSLSNDIMGGAILAVITKHNAAMMAEKRIYNNFRTKYTLPFKEADIGVSPQGEEIHVHMSREMVTKGYNLDSSSLPGSVVIRNDDGIEFMLDFDPGNRVFSFKNLTTGISHMKKSVSVRIDFNGINYDIPPGNSKKINISQKTPPSLAINSNRSSLKVFFVGEYFFLRDFKLLGISSIAFRNNQAKTILDITGSGSGVLQVENTLEAPSYLSYLPINREDIRPDLAMIAAKPSTRLKVLELMRNTIQDAIVLGNKTTNEVPIFKDDDISKIGDGRMVVVSLVAEYRSILFPDYRISLKGKVQYIEGDANLILRRVENAIRELNLNYKNMNDDNWTAPFGPVEFPILEGRYFRVVFDRGEGGKAEFLLKMFPVKEDDDAYVVQINDGPKLKRGDLHRIALDMYQRQVLVGHMPVEVRLSYGSVYISPGYGVGTIRIIDQMNDWYSPMNLYAEGKLSDRKVIDASGMRFSLLKEGSAKTIEQAAAIFYKRKRISPEDAMDAIEKDPHKVWLRLDWKGKFSLMLIDKAMMGKGSFHNLDIEGIIFMQSVLARIRKGGFRVMISDSLGSTIQKYLLILEGTIDGLPIFQRNVTPTNNLSGLYYFDHRMNRFMEFEGDETQFSELFKALDNIDDEFGTKYLLSLLDDISEVLHEKEARDSSKDSAMTREEELFNSIKDPILTSSYISQVVNGLKGKMIHIKFGAREISDRFFENQRIERFSQDTPPPEILRDEIGFWWDAVDEKGVEIKRMVRVKEKFLIAAIARLSSIRIQDARLLLLDLDQELTDEKIDQIADVFFVEINDPLLTPERIKDFPSLQYREYVIKDSSLVLRKYIKSYSHMTTKYAFKYNAAQYQSGVRLIFPKIPGASHKEEELVFEPGFLKLVIAFLYEVDPPQARKLVADLFDISAQQQAEAARTRILNKEPQKVPLLQILSEALSENKTKLRNPEIGKNIESYLHIFYFGPEAKETGGLYYDNGGLWGFKGDKNEYFIWLADLLEVRPDIFDKFNNEPEVRELMVAKEGPMVLKKRFDSLEDDIFSWERVSRLAKISQGHIINLKLPYEEHLEQYFKGIKGNVYGVQADKIGVSWEIHIDDQNTVKRMVVVTKEDFIRGILELYNQKSYLARLLILDIDGSITDAEINQAVVRRLKRMMNKGLLKPEDMKTILELDRKGYFVDDNSVPLIDINSMPIDFIIFFLFLTTRDRAFELNARIKNSSTTGVELLLFKLNKNHGQLQKIIFQPGYLRELIADAYELDAQEASRFIEVLRHRQMELQLWHVRAQMDTDSRTSLDIISSWLSHSNGPIELPADLGEDIQKFLIKKGGRTFEHYPDHLNDECRLFYRDGSGGFWGFSGNRWQLFIMLANLSKGDLEIYARLLTRLMDYPELEKRIMDYYEMDEFHQELSRSAAMTANVPKAHNGNVLIFPQAAAVPTNDPDITEENLLTLAYELKKKAGVYLTASSQESGISFNFEAFGFPFVESDSSSKPIYLPFNKRDEFSKLSPMQIVARMRLLLRKHPAEANRLYFKLRLALGGLTEEQEMRYAENIVNRSASSVSEWGMGKAFTWGMLKDLGETLSTVDVKDKIYGLLKQQFKSGFHKSGVPDFPGWIYGGYVRELKDRGTGIYGLPNRTRWKGRHIYLILNQDWYAEFTQAQFLFNMALLIKTDPKNAVVYINDLEQFSQNKAMTVEVQIPLTRINELLNARGDLVSATGMKVPYYFDRQRFVLYLGSVPFVQNIYFSSRESVSVFGPLVIILNPDVPRPLKVFYLKNGHEYIDVTIKALNSVIPGENLRTKTGPFFHLMKESQITQNGVLILNRSLRISLSGLVRNLDFQQSQEADNFLNSTRMVNVQTATRGGIDLNTSNGMQWTINKEGNGVEMNIDPAMIERIRVEGLDSLSPVILRMTPVASIWSLVGLPKK